MSRPAAGGGRWVEVAPERLDRWLAGFSERHGGYAPVAEERGAVAGADGVGLCLRAADGETARLYSPPGVAPADEVDQLVAAANVSRRIGLLLVRRGGYAVGVAEGSTLMASKVDSRYVQGRTAAGGQSQQRFARRRANQAHALADSAADLVARLLLPERDRIAALVTGGDRRLVDEVLAEPRLGSLAPLRAARFLEVGDPKLVVLEAAVLAARAVRIHLAGPVGPEAGAGGHRQP